VATLTPQYAAAWAFVSRRGVMMSVLLQFTTFATDSDHNLLHHASKITLTNQ
jgi:hypothetical protein